MFSDRLKKCREEQGLSQIAVSQKLNITRQAYNHYETGKRSPSSEMLTRLSALFNVSADYLLGITDIPNFSDQNIKEDVPEVGTPEWLRLMFQKIGVDVDELTDAQIDILVKNSGSLAQMFREELAKNKKE